MPGSGVGGEGVERAPKYVSELCLWDRQHNPAPKVASQMLSADCANKSREGTYGQKFKNHLVFGLEPEW